MLRLVAAALTATLAYPACAESGFAAVSLPLGSASSVLGPGTACEFPLHPSADPGSIAPAAGPSMTLSPRMIQAIRIDADIPAD